MTGTGAEPAPELPETVNLMEALKASIETARASKGRVVDEPESQSVPQPPVTLDVGDLRPPRTETRHLWAQELVRAGLAIAFFLLLALTVIWALVLAGGLGWANAKEALQILLPAETGLLGSAAGFYFGSRRP